jgi:energy-coupling factor transporter ATP-binding protein EcfA2
MRLIVENIRSFAGRHEVDLRPLTILVGENSSGKSTLLAALAALSDKTSFPGKLAVNKEPHDLGTYRTIATFKGGKFGRAKTFSIGFCNNQEKAGNDLPKVLATYREAKGDSVLAELKIETSNTEASLHFAEGKMTGFLISKTDRSVPELLLDEAIPKVQRRQVQLESEIDSTAISIAETLPHFLFRALKDKQEQVSHFQPNEIFQLARDIARFIPTAGSIAPIRSKPRRVYDRSSVSYEPGGDHIPYILARLLNDEQDKRCVQISDAMKKFGEESGLFKRIAAPILGKHEGDPFEIEVSIAGPPTNILDVGYGVSQSLPIIVESVLAAPSTRLLVQQPEVHLHPKAQAALGTFLVDMVRDGKRQFVVETHSDYILDRIRQEVANNKLPAESVVFVFLDKPHIETTIYHLYLDKAGNILNAPPSYRTFFLEEEINLLNRTAAK